MTSVSSNHLALPISRLGDLCEVIIGRTPSRYEQSYWGSDVPWLSIADMNQGKWITSTKEKISKSGYEASGSRLIKPGTLLFSFKLSIGKVSIAQMSLCTNEAIAALPIKDSATICPEYLYWALRSLNAADDGDRAVMGITLNKEKLNSLQIPVPPLSVQRHIADILDRADALRAKRRAALARLDELTQAIFVEMFGAAHDNSEEIGPHLTFVTSGGRGWAKYYQDSGARFIRSLDVRMNFIGDVQPAYVAPPDNAEARRTKVQQGDVLLTITGSQIGRVAPVDASFEGAYISQHVAILRPDHCAFLPRFLSYYLSAPFGGQPQIAAAQYGQTKPGLNFDQIRRFRVPRPQISQQQRFEEYLDKISGLMRYQTQSEIDLNALFASLQSRAFRGAL